GNTETLALWREQAGRTVVPLRLDPCGSAFVVFARRSRGVSHFVALDPGAPDAKQTDAMPADAVRLLESGGAVRALVSSPGRWTLRNAAGSRSPLEVPALPAPLVLKGPWVLTFPHPPAATTRRRPARPVRVPLTELISWSELPEAQGRYFSGTALYRTRFDLPAGLLDAGRALWLELGEVHEIAAVRLNGTALGVLWKPPFTVEITSAVRAGRNSLSLRVTNTWRNALIGDYGRPADDRDTFVVPMLRKGEPWLPGGPGVALSPAGVLGPVTIRSIGHVAL